MIPELKQRVETSGEYLKWKKDNPEAYFYLVFTMFEKLSMAEFELSYFSPKTKLATVFSVGEQVALKGEDKTFGDDTPLALELNQIKLGISEAIDIAKAAQVENYKGETPLKEIIMLQTLEAHPVWNITFFTVSFSTLNIKLDASTGKLLHHSLQKLFDFVK